jgi:hypothetical protein
VGNIVRDHRRLASSGVFHPHAAAFCDHTFAEQTKTTAVRGRRLYTDLLESDAPHLCRSAWDSFSSVEVGRDAEVVVGLWVGDCAPRSLYVRCGGGVVAVESDRRGVSVADGGNIYSITSTIHCSLDQR